MQQTDGKNMAFWFTLLFSDDNPSNGLQVEILVYIRSFGKQVESSICISWLIAVLQSDFIKSEPL